MNTTRRRFIKVSGIAGSAVSFGMMPKPSLFAAAAEKAGGASARPAKPINILILGGTGFTGPHQVRYALSRGHKVTVFNRGKTHPGELPEGVEQLIGDRNGQLDALMDRKWDVVIDNPTMLPAWVRDAARILKGNVDRYVFISTISVFGDNSQPGMDENGPLAKYDGPDAMQETRDTVVASQFKLYGPLKALSEQEAEKWFPKKALIIRPGLIVGPGDETDRFTYWPVRVDRGGEVLAPGAPTHPVQIIDARDLAEWTIRMIENGEAGVYNATGPALPLTIGGMLDGLKTAFDSNATFTWADAKFLEEHKVEPWSDMPVWVPPEGEMAGFAYINIKRALDKGLTFRPLPETGRDTLQWFKSLPAERQAKLKAGITPEREKELLEAWHKAKA